LLPVTKAEGKSLTFDIEAVDSGGSSRKVIGKGTHTRAVVNAKRFMEKLGVELETGEPK
jgi:fluoroacetyl-CoA thioesterase